METLPLTIWEPAAGRGAIVKVLRAAGHTVVASDITAYDFELDFVADFLATVLPPPGCGMVVTNPPYGMPQRSRVMPSIWCRAYTCCVGSHSSSPQAAPTSLNSAVSPASTCSGTGSR